MLNIVSLWVWFCAYLNCAGWLLSALHQLNATGYAVALAVWFGSLVVWWKKTPVRIQPSLRWQKFYRRFRRPFPLAFLILAGMAFLGGALYAPTNYDALAYRLPRILHWLAAGQWHWIHSVFERINNRSCGIEWVSAPIIALFKTDRFLFLINVVSFLLLPGLIFSLFTRLGIRRRVAWHWMWIVPTGYCFVLQAGSIGNDLFGAPFALAAVNFALRAVKTKSWRDFSISILAAAMMTSAKTSSLPLMLPWAVAIFPVLKWILRQPLKVVAILVIAVFASALPTMVLNQKFSHDWSGAKLGHASQTSDMAVRAGANVLLIIVQNVSPPVFPVANLWNDGIKKLMPSELSVRLHEVMVEREAAEFTLPQMQMEENAGLGFGVSLLLGASFLWVKFRRQNSVKTITRTPARQFFLLRWSFFISLLALMTQYGLSVFCRILTPYYALLIPVFLTDWAHIELLRKKWWRAGVYAVFAIAAGLLIVSPARPLFPIETILDHWSTAPTRLREVYSVYQNRNDGFAPVRDQLPPDLKVLGMITYDDPETSLWWPLGSRRIEHVCPGDTAADLRARDVNYVLFREEALNQLLGYSMENWLKQMNAHVVQKIPLNLRASRGVVDWYLMKLD